MMQRRSLLFFGALSPVALLMSRYMRARTPKASITTDYREQAQRLRDQAERLNTLAATIEIPADAGRFVDFLAGIFSDQLLPAWSNGPLLDRIAQAEFAAVTDSERLIPELRLAHAWNTYVETVHAPDASYVTPAEVHNLRDGFYAVSRLSWERGARDIWSVPSVCATQPDGKLASGCRAVESIRIFWDLANMPDNLKAARNRVNEGVLISDQLRELQTRPIASGRRVVRVEARVISNPLRVAAKQYIKDNGVVAYSKVVVDMINLALA